MKWRGALRLERVPRALLCEAKAQGLRHLRLAAVFPPLWWRLLVLCPVPTPFPFPFPFLPPFLCLSLCPFLSRPQQQARPAKLGGNDWQQGMPSETALKCETRSEQRLLALLRL